MKYHFQYCFAFIVTGLILIGSSDVDADVIVTDANGFMNVIDADDPNLPDPDPTTFGAGDVLNSTDSLVVDGFSVFNLSGGSLDGFSDFVGNSTLNVASGSAGFVLLSDNAMANVSGGAITSLESMSGNAVTISGGAVDFGGTASGDIAISDGTVNAADFFIGSGDSLEVSGGNVSVGNLSIFDGGTATISGGVDFDNLFIIDVSGAGSSLNLVGSDFLLRFEDFDNNVFTDTPVTGQITDSLFFDGISGTSLVGTLADGTEFRINEASLTDGGVINLVAVPEPSTLGLLGLIACVGVMRRKRSHGMPQILKT